MNKRICFLFVCLIFTLSACASKPHNRMEIYSRNNELVISTQNNDRILQILQIINDYQEYDGSVEADEPNYIIKLSPANSSNGSEEYKVWITDDKIIYLPPQLSDEPPKLAVSSHDPSDFSAIFNRN